MIRTATLRQFVEENLLDSVSGNHFVIGPLRWKRWNDDRRELYFAVTRQLINGPRTTWVGCAQRGRPPARDPRPDARPAADGPRDRGRARMGPALRKAVADLRAAPSAQEQQAVRNDAQARAIG